MRQRLGQQVGEGRGPQRGELGRRGDEFLGAEPPRVGRGGRHIGEVGVVAVPEYPLPCGGIAVGDDVPSRPVPVPGDPVQLGRVLDPRDGAHPQVVHHGEHRVRDRHGHGVAQLGPGDPVAQHAAQTGDVPGGPGRRYVLAARTVEQRPEEAVPTAGGVQPPEGRSVRVHGVRGTGRSPAEEGHVLGRALRAALRGRQVGPATGEFSGVLGGQCELGQRQRAVGERPGDPRGGRVGQTAYVLRRDQGGRRESGRWRGQQGLERGVGPGGGTQLGRRAQEVAVLLGGRSGRRIGGGGAGGTVTVGDHPAQQVRGHAAVAVAGRGVRAAPAQAVHEGYSCEEFPVVRVLFGVRAECFAQGAHLLEGAGQSEGVRRFRARVKARVARQALQVGTAGLGSEEPPPSRPLRALGEHRAYMAVLVPGRARLRGRRVHLASGPVRHMLGHRQPGHLRLPPGLAGEQHQRPVLTAVLRPGLEHLAQLHTADLHGGPCRVLGSECDGTGGAVPREVVGAAPGARTGECRRRPGEHRPGRRRGRGGPGCRSPGGGTHATEGLLAEQRPAPRTPFRTVLGRALRDGQRLHGCPRPGPRSRFRHQAPQLRDGHCATVQGGDDRIARAGCGAASTRGAGVAAAGALPGRGVHVAASRLQERVRRCPVLGRAGPAGVQDTVAYQ